MKIEEGKTYLNGEGRTVGPMRIHNQYAVKNQYKYQADSNQCNYTEDGAYWEHATDYDTLNLVEEIDRPKPTVETLHAADDRMAHVESMKECSMKQPAPIASSFTETCRAIKDLVPAETSPPIGASTSVLSDKPAVTHKLKIHLTHYTRVKAGTKTFEIRENDRSFQKGDHVVLKYYNLIGNSLYDMPNLTATIGDVYPIDATRVVFSLLDVKVAS